MKGYSRREWIEACVAAFAVLVFVYGLFGPLGGRLMP